MSGLYMLYDMELRKKNKGIREAYVQVDNTATIGESVWVFRDNSGRFEMYNPETVYVNKEEMKGMTARIIKKSNKGTQNKGIDTYEVTEELIDKEYVNELVKRVHAVLNKECREDERKELKLLLHDLKKVKFEDVESLNTLKEQMESGKLRKHIKREVINLISVMDEKTRRAFFRRLR